jgi:hypothetical protein
MMTLNSWKRKKSAGSFAFLIDGIADFLPGKPGLTRPIQGKRDQVVARQGAAA